MAPKSIAAVTIGDVVAGLRKPAAYPHVVPSPVVAIETHISWVFLAGDYAYKVKKPITTDFLDYGTLAKRQFACQEELRLDNRYSEDLYLDVVPITLDQGCIKIGGSGNTVEFAVKMRRFPDDALLSHRLERGLLNTREVRELAASIANFHRGARRAEVSSPFGDPAKILDNALQNIIQLRSAPLLGSRSLFDQLECWTNEYFKTHKTLFKQRIVNGFIRECHGDLHLDNIVFWNNRLIPFDGIEFNEDFHWIDVLSDAAFLAMDLTAHGRSDLSRSFVNGYLEQTGDYASVSLLHWYLTYRALVRAKVAAMRAAQIDNPGESTDVVADCQSHIDLAHEMTVPAHRHLWITYGLSGSGKTTGSESIIQQYGAIRLRSDVERKRFYGLSDMHRPSATETRSLYCDAANRATYGRLKTLASHILRSGFSVIVDATFLRHSDRQTFVDLARTEAVPLGILHFSENDATLKRRLIERGKAGTDASDAGIKVLQMQREEIEPLTQEELRITTAMSSQSFNPKP